MAWLAIMALMDAMALIAFIAFMALMDVMALMAIIPLIFVIAFMAKMTTGRYGMICYRVHSVNNKQHSNQQELQTQYPYYRWTSRCSCS